MAFLGTDAEWQADILKEIGDDGIVGTDIQVIWGKHTSKGYLSKELQALYTKVDAISRLLGSVRKRYSFKSKDSTDNLKELTENLRAMRDEAICERDRL